MYRSVFSSRAIVSSRRHFSRCTTAMAAPATTSRSPYAALAPLLKPVDAVFDAVRGTRVVLFGEASHGTQEFYTFRCEVTQRMIVEQGVKAVCIEGDFAEVSSLHRYVMGYSSFKDVDAALEAFLNRFAVWMWRNVPTRDFLIWLRGHNATRPCEERCGIFGLDLYGMVLSMQAVVGYLKPRDPTAAAAVRAHYSCFDPFSRDPQRYGQAVASNLHAGCRAAVLAARSRLVAHVKSFARPTNSVDERDEAFMAEANASVVVDAERYYRAMFEWDDSSWNVRDRHFDDVLYRVRAHLRSSRGPDADRVVVWAHNSHVGDASGTERAKRGETNLGELSRSVGGKSAIVNVGQFTYSGTVTAASEWGEATTMFDVSPAMAGSVEAAMHDLTLQTGRTSLSVDLRPPAAQAALSQDPLPTRLERAIGVVYKPRTELQSHMIPVRLGAQFDIAVWFDRTTALVPLDAPMRPRTPDITPLEPEMDEYPFGV